MTIKEVEEQLGLSRATIRFYERNNSFFTRALISNYQFRYFIFVWITMVLCEKKISTNKYGREASCVWDCYGDTGCGGFCNTSVCYI